MSIILSKEQQKALDAERTGPLQVVDPRNNSIYLLIPAEEYQNLRELLEEEKVREAVHAAALRNAVGRINEAP